MGKTALGEFVVRKLDVPSHSQVIVQIVSNIRGLNNGLPLH